MKKNISSLFIATVMVAFGAAQAADTTELKVKGVVQPPACTPTLASGGVIDYGVIPAKSINQTRGTMLDEKTLPFSISCNAPTKLAVRMTDNRSTSAVNGLAQMVPGAGQIFTDSFAYGLGSVAGKNIGMYVLAFKQGSFKADTTILDSIASTDKVYWRKPAIGSPAKSEIGSWTSAGGTTPGSYKNIAGTLAVTVVIDKGSNLPLTQEIPLDGSATLEVVYL